MSDHNQDDDNENTGNVKVVFMSGCFDDFDGTQEELNDLVAHIKQLAASGELERNATPVLDDDLVEKLESLADGSEEYELDEHGYVKYPFDNTRH